MSCLAEAYLHGDHAGRIEGGAMSHVIHARAREHVLSVLMQALIFEALLVAPWPPVSI
jgi:hypothetical protein